MPECWRRLISGKYSLFTGRLFWIGLYHLSWAFDAKLARPSMFKDMPPLVHRGLRH